MYFEEHRFIDAIYLTVITLSTVGFETIKPLSDEGKIFVVVFILFNFSIITYAITLVTRYFYDGIFNKKVSDIKMKDNIQKLKGHVIVCGGGRNGFQALEILKQNQLTTVLIDKSNDTEHLKFVDYFIHGDCTNDETLTQANIQTAKSIIIAIPNDAECLFTVLSARQLNKNLKIISRATLESSRNKLKLAGADNVILPEHIGGAYMASLVFSSDIKEFIDILSTQYNENFMIKELECKTSIYLHHLNAWYNTGANIIGVKNVSNNYILNPDKNYQLKPNDKIIVIGNKIQIEHLQNILIQ